QQCEEHAATAKKLADIADATDQKVKAYETRLAQLDQAAADRLKTIEEILPSAASAGLAFAFNRRRAAFKWPLGMWQAVFLFTMLALLGLAFWELNMSPGASELTWEKFGLSWLIRLPFALPIIWLAIHAS